MIMVTMKVVLGVLFLGLLAEPRQELIREEDKSIHEQGVLIAKEFYFLDEGLEFKELTQAILESAETEESVRDQILATGRRFFLFTYPSDGFRVKGTLSFLPDSEESSLLVFLRGGNKMFGLKHPATDLTCAHPYTVITTTYRGGVSEGKDEYGGVEVNDIQNLIDFFPKLQEKIGVHFSPKKKFILGRSRGGMEMFLALSRSMALQNQFHKAVSLSGPLDFEDCLANYEDYRMMMIKEFGLKPGENEESWIASRNPVANVSTLRKDLPILIRQGTEDLRVGLNEGVKMVNTLKENGNVVTYIEIEGGNHCLDNQPNRMEMITKWLEE